MPDIFKLKQLIEAQNELSEKIAAETSGFSGDDLLSENARLQAENEKLAEEFKEISDARKALYKENQSLKEALKNQMYAERSHILGRSREKMAAYFSGGTQDGVDGLTQFEKNAKERFLRLRRALDDASFETRLRYTQKLDALERELLEAVQRSKRSYGDAEQAAFSEYSADTRPLGKKDIDERAEKEIITQSNHKVERMFGLNLLGKIGAVIIVVGMIVLSQWLYSEYGHNDLGKLLICIFMFTGATAVLGIGLFLNRKSQKRTIFSITILSLGIALEYAALSITYFASDSSLNVWIALAICAVITVGSYFISYKLKSEVVAIFAQIGGYLPVLAFILEVALAGEFTEMGMLYGAMVYFIILNVSGFLLSSKYKWQILNYIAFGLNIFAVIFVSASVAALYITLRIARLETVLTLVFMFVSFGLHTLLPVLTGIRTKLRFARPDFVLMTLTTAVNLILFYVMFELYRLGDYSGYLSLFFAAFYFGLYFLVRFFFSSDKSIKTLFWMTSVVFLTLFMPMHFKLEWIIFGWILQSAVLVIYGILKEKKVSLSVGVASSLLSLVFFIFFDWRFGNGNNVIYVTDASTGIATGFVNIFIYKYALLTLASLAVLAMLVYKRRLILGYLDSDARIFRTGSLRPAQYYCVAAYLNAAGFLVYFTYKMFEYATVSTPNLIRDTGSIQYLMYGIMAIIMFGFAAAAPKLFKEKSVYNASLVLGIFSLIFLLVVNCQRLPAFPDGPIGEKVAAVFLTATVALASLYVFYDFCDKISKAKVSRTGSLSWPMPCALYFLFTFTLLMLWQYRIAYNNVAVSIVYILTALGCLAIGIFKHDVVTRRFALGLTAASIFKIFVIDFIGAWEYNRILFVINCFVFGAVLIGMSFLYQLFYRRFAKLKESGTEELEEGQTDAKED
ncbi:MAG: DUF2339 domain-containing protein [Firmicutes bacterium]|nr:DUF2339 domain-containing protein [Bacillota bacterium]